MRTGLLSTPCGKTTLQPDKNGRIRLRILVDRTSLEIFGNGGRFYIPFSFFPRDDNKTLKLVAGQGGARR